MKFKNILILEETGCDASKCEGSWTTITATQYDTYKTQANIQACFTAPSSYKYCKLKKKENPPVDNSKPCVQPTECPPNVEEFLTWYWKDKGWVDASGNPDTKSHQDEINGVDLNSKKCVTKKYSNTYEGAKTKYTGKCKAGATGTEGLKIAYANSKEKYTPTQNIVTVDQTTTTTTVKPIDPEVQKFRNEFDVEFFPIVDQLGLTPDQWGRMHNTMPDINPPTSYRVLQQITAKIVDYIGKFYRSKEFGLFVEILDTFIELYGDKTDSEGNVTKNSVIKPEFFTNFGGTIEEVKVLSQSIKTKNTQVANKMNYDSLSDPETNVENLFQEVIVTVLEEPQNYFTKPLQMYAFRYTRLGAIPDIDLSPINKVLDGAVDQLNCLSVLDVYGKYRLNTLVSKELRSDLVTKGQKCLCKNFYKDLGKLSIKDKFDKEKRTLAKKRLATYNTMGISINNC